MHYSEVPALGNVYLEDSFVLGITENAGELTFTIEAVLTEQHPAYTPPNPGEQYCYADAQLVLTHTSAVQWVRRAATTYTDASGEVDLGNIDQMDRVDDHWRISGDWGEVLVYTDEAPELRLQAASPA